MRMKKRKVTRAKGTRKKGLKRRRSSGKRRSMLSEFFTPATAQGGFKTVLSGAVGAVAGAALNKMTPNQSDTTRAAIKLLGGYLFATLGKMPNVGAGLAAVGTYELITTSGFLSEDMKEANYADSLDKLPAYLQEPSPMYLAENNPMYLSENDYLAEDDLSYDVGYYGSGFGMDNVNF